MAIATFPRIEEEVGRPVIERPVFDHATLGAIDTAGADCEIFDDLELDAAGHLVNGLRFQVIAQRYGCFQAGCSINDEKQINGRRLTTEATES